ncbi:MAG: hypothetical protein WBP93_08180 [Pyrinomonadaceae bacterium]
MLFGNFDARQRCLGGLASGGSVSASLKGKYRIERRPRAKV